MNHLFRRLGPAFQHPCKTESNLSKTVHSSYFDQSVSNAVRSKSVSSAVLVFDRLIVFDRIMIVFDRTFSVFFLYCSLARRLFTQILQFSVLGGKVYHQYLIKKKYAGWRAELSTILN